MLSRKAKVLLCIQRKHLHVTLNKNSTKSPVVHWTPCSAFFRQTEHSYRICKDLHEMKSKAGRHSAGRTSVTQLRIRYFSFARGAPTFAPGNLPRPIFPRAGGRNPNAIFQNLLTCNRTRHFSCREHDNALNKRLCDLNYTWIHGPVKSASPRIFPLNSPEQIEIIPRGSSRGGMHIEWLDAFAGYTRPTAMKLPHIFFTPRLM